MNYNMPNGGRFGGFIVKAEDGEEHHFWEESEVSRFMDEEKYYGRTCSVDLVELFYNQKVYDILKPKNS